MFAPGLRSDRATLAPSRAARSAIARPKLVEQFTERVDHSTSDKKHYDPEHIIHMLLKVGFSLRSFPRRIASINDLPIKDGERKYHWPLGRRPDDHASLSDLGL
jgi:hypothetical protein